MRSSSVSHTQLTDARVERVANTALQADLFVRDAYLKGFGLRVSPRNVKSFFVEATVQGRFVRKVLGQFPLLTVTDAREQGADKNPDQRCTQPDSRDARFIRGPSVATCRQT